MVVRTLITLAALASVYASVTTPHLFLFAPFAIAFLGYLVWRFSRPFRHRFRPGGKGLVIVDGSNIMYWKDGAPRIEAVREVLAHLKQHGFTAGVVFDANAGYLLTGKHERHDAMAGLLDLPEERVMMATRGTPADPFILTAARDLGARIVSNDRFREWAETFPEVRDRGYLITGAYRAGELTLEIDNNRAA